MTRYSQNDFSHWEDLLSMSRGASCWAASGMTLLTELGKTEEIVLNKIKSIRNSSQNPKERGERYDTLIKCDLLSQDRVNSQSGLRINQRSDGVDLKKRIKKIVRLRGKHIKGLIEHSFYSDAKHTLYVKTSGQKDDCVISIWNPSKDGTQYNSIDDYINTAITKYSLERVEGEPLNLSYYTL